MKGGLTSLGLEFFICDDGRFLIGIDQILYGSDVPSYFDPLKGRLLAVEPRENLTERRNGFLLIGAALLVPGLFFLLFGGAMEIIVAAVSISLCILCIAWAVKLGPIEIYEAGIEVNGLKGSSFIAWDGIDEYIEGRGMVGLRLVYYTKSILGQDGVHNIHNIDVPESTPDFHKLSEYIKSRVDTDPNRGRRLTEPIDGKPRPP